MKCINGDNLEKKVESIVSDLISSGKPLLIAADVDLSLAGLSFRLHGGKICREIITPLNEINNTRENNVIIPSRRPPGSLLRICERSGLSPEILSIALDGRRCNSKYWQQVFRLAHVRRKVQAVEVRAKYNEYGNPYLLTIGNSIRADGPMHAIADCGIHIGRNPPAHASTAMQTKELPYLLNRLLSAL